MNRREFLKTAAIAAAGVASAAVVGVQAASPEVGFFDTTPRMLPGKVYCQIWADAEVMATFEVTDFVSEGEWAATPVENAPLKVRLHEPA